jgi:hypothetical protein
MVFDYHSAKQRTACGIAFERLGRHKFPEVEQSATAEAARPKRVRVSAIGIERVLAEPQEKVVIAGDAKFGCEFGYILNVCGVH